MRRSALLLDDLNNRPMRGWGTSRRALFEQLDRPALGSLPSAPYEYAEWKRCRVGFDYHVEIAKHYYSVPHQLIRQEVEARITARHGRDLSSRQARRQSSAQLPARTGRQP